MQNNSSLAPAPAKVTQAAAVKAPIRRFSVARLPLSGRPVVIAAKAS